jgi:hypothetical protein
VGAHDGRAFENEGGKVTITQRRRNPKRWWTGLAVVVADLAENVSGLGESVTNAAETGVEGSPPHFMEGMTAEFEVA